MIKEKHKMAWKLVETAVFFFMFPYVSESVHRFVVFFCVCVRLLNID